MQKYVVWFILAIFSLNILPTKIHAQSCAQNLPPRLTAGESGRVITASANNLRNQPGLSTQIIGQIPDGGAILVLDGPICIDGVIWYKVSHNGAIGWTAESGDGIYWIEPDSVSSTVPNTAAESAQTNVVCNLTTLQGVNLRSGPGTSFPQTGSRPYNNTFAADAQQQDSGGYRWWRVADGTIDDGLWVREDLVTEAGQCESLPTPDQLDTTDTSVAEAQPPSVPASDINQSQPIVPDSEAGTIVSDENSTTTSAEPVEVDLTGEQPTTVNVAAAEAILNSYSRNTGDIVASDDLSEDSLGWLAEPGADEIIRFENGKMVLEISTAEGGWITLPSNGLRASGTYEVSVDISDVSSESGNYCVALVYDIQSDGDNLNMYVCQNGFWLAGGAGRRFGRGWSAPINLLDGETHTLTLRVEENNHALLLDGVPVGAVTGSNARVTDGRVGVGLLSFYEDEGQDFNVSAAFSNLVIREVNLESPPTVYDFSEQPVVFADRFDSDINNWGGKNIVLCCRDTRIDVQNGVLTLDTEGKYPLLAVPGFSTDSAPVFRSPFEMSVNVQALDLSGDPETWFGIAFDVQGDANEVDYLRDYVVLRWRADGYYFTHFYGDELKPFAQPIPNVFDGAWHNIRIQVLRERLIVFIDNQEVINERTAFNTYGNIGLSVYTLDRDRGGERVVAQFDDLMIRQPEQPEVETITVEADSSMAGMTALDTSQLARDSDVLFFDTFDSVKPDWTGYGDVTPIVQNGSYTLQVQSTSQTGRAARIDLEELILTEPHEIEFEVSNLNSTSFWDLNLRTNIREFSTLFGPTGASLIFIVKSNGTWEFDLAGDVSQSPFRGNLPAGLDLNDGQTYRFRMRLEEGSGGLRATLFINDEEIASVVTDFYTPNDFLSPTLEEIYGYPAISYTVRGREDAVGNGQIFVDNVVVRRYRPDMLVEGTGTGAPTNAFTRISRLTLSLPDGWESARLFTPTGAAVTNEEAFNVELFNSRQGLTDGPNEIRLRIIEPVSVMETAGIVNSRSVELADTLEAYLERSGVRYDEITPTQIGNRPAVMAASTEQGAYRHVWFAMRSSDETVVILEATVSLAQADTLLGTVVAIAETIDYLAPTVPDEDIIEPVQEYLYFANSGRFPAALAAVCPADLAAAAILGAGVLGGLDAMGGGQGDDVFEFEPQPQQAIEFTIDDSGRYYEIVDSSDTVAQVRVSGNVVINYADGTQQIVPHDEFYIEPIRTFFGAQTYRVEKRGSTWQLCTGAFAF